MSDSAQIFLELQSYIVEQLGVEKEKVTPDAAFIEDLNADSLDLVEFAMGLEEKFGVTAAAPIMMGGMMSSATCVARRRPAAPIMVTYIHEMGRMPAEPKSAALTMPTGARRKRV